MRVVVEVHGSDVDGVVLGGPNLSVTIHSNWSLDSSPASVWAVNVGEFDASRALGKDCEFTGVWVKL